MQGVGSLYFNSVERLELNQNNFERAMSDIDTNLQKVFKEIVISRELSDEQIERVLKNHQIQAIDIKNDPDRVVRVCNALGKDAVRREAVLKIVKGTDRVPNRFTYKWQNDRDICLAIVTKPDLDNHSYLKHVDKNFLDDEEFMLAALESGIRAITYASDRLKEKRDFLHKAILIKPYILKYQFVKDFFADDRDLVLQLVQEKPNVLSDVSDRLKNDQDVMEAAIGKHASAFQYVGSELKGNREWLKKIVKGKPAIYRKIILLDRKNRLDHDHFICESGPPVKEDLELRKLAGLPPPKEKSPFNKCLMKVLRIFAGCINTVFSRIGDAIAYLR